MLLSGDMHFLWTEILSLIGMAQCIYILVYFAFRAGNILRVAVPSIYFAVLAMALLSDAFYRQFHPTLPIYDLVQWYLWLLCPCLSYLLIIQIAQITKTPSWPHYIVLLPISLVFAGVIISIRMEDLSFSDVFWFYPYLTLYGLVLSAIPLLIILTRRHFLSFIHGQAVMGRERYWLVIAFIVMNVLLMAVMWVFVYLPSQYASIDVLFALRAIVAGGGVYIASTSLLRIYPYAVRLIEPSLKASKENLSASISQEEASSSQDKPYRQILSDDEISIAMQVEKLLNFDKIYHEASFSRRDMANELKISEALLSKVINHHFKKSFPQLLNERRVQDAKRMLDQTDVPAYIIGQEVGFNSLASFNRVFKNISGQSPSQYRASK